MDLLDFISERCLSCSTPLYTATSAVRSFLLVRILFNCYTSYIAFLDRWTRLSFLEQTMITMLQARVAAILFLMITITLLENDIDPTPWRGRQAALAACALAHAVAFAILVTPVESTRKSGMEETVKQWPAQMSTETLVCLFGNLIPVETPLLPLCCQIWAVSHNGRFEGVGP